MGKGAVKFSAHCLESSLQLPNGWHVAGVVFDPDSSSLVLSIEGETVNQGEEYQALFTSRVLDCFDGRWVQAKWEIAPQYYGTIEDLKRTWNLPEVSSRGTH